MTLNYIWLWSYNSGAQRNIEYLFIAIPTRTTLTRSGSTYQGHIYDQIEQLADYFHLIVKKIIRNIYAKIMNVQ